MTRGTFAASFAVLDVTRIFATPLYDSRDARLPRRYGTAAAR